VTEHRYTLQDLNEVPATAIEDRTERDSWLPLNLAYLPDEPPVKPTLGGFGIVYPGKRHVFSGPQERAKTLAAYAIGLETIRAGHTITIIDFEMGAYAARTRLRELGASNTDLEHLHYLEPQEPATPDKIHTIISLNPTLVIIDAAAGAYDLQGLDDNKRGDVERFTHLYVRGFWKAGIATITLDHVVKNTETRGKYAIGSERKTGGVDVHLGFDTIKAISRGGTGLYKITTHKDRDGYLQRGQLAELHLQSDPESHRIRWEFRPAEHIEPGETWMPTKLMEKISGLIQGAHEPPSRKQIIDQAGGRPEYARKAIDHLVRLEYVTETPGPRQAKLLKTTRPFTVSEWENQPDTPHGPTWSPHGPGPGLPTWSRPSPPYGGTDHVTAADNGRHGPELGSWIDDLEPPPREDPPGDLYDEPPLPF
jgi:hypothetical protein